MTINSNNIKFYWIYLIGFFLILSLPLLAVPPLFHPAPWGKTIIFRIILSILIFFFTYNIIYKKEVSSFKKIEPKAVKQILSLLGITLSFYLLSTIFSQDLNFSFWGSPWRAGGFLNFFFYALLSVFVFLVVRERDWKKIWNFSISIGVLVSLFGISQYFSLFSNFIVSSETVVASTMGNSSLFAIYLSFLLFLALSLGLKERVNYKKVAYFSAIALFIFGIFISGARSTYMGIIVGLFFFFFFYPKKIAKIKIITGIFLLLSIFSVYYLNSYPTPPDIIKNNATLSRTFSYLASRTSLKTAIADLSGARFSTWSIGLKAIKEKPILGWGPENFSIGFDKYYDPSLPQMEKLWWDRAHNFLIEYAVTGGIPFLISFLLLVGFLFWQIQKLKKEDCLDRTDINNSLLIHGIQAALIAYLVNIFFTFDSIDTYLMFFLLLGYCLHIISSHQKEQIFYEKESVKNDSPALSMFYKWRKPIIICLSIITLIFIWSYNLKPLLINKETNWAEYYSINGSCQKAINKMENILPQHSIIDEYVMLQYSSVFKECLTTNPEQTNELAKKDIQILERAIKLRPTYTRTWSLLGNYYNLIVDNNPNINPEEKEAFLTKADYYFGKANKLSPKRQEVFLGWSDTYLLWEKYEEAKNKTDQCIRLNENFGNCYWQKALCNVILGEIQESNDNLKKGEQYGFRIDSDQKRLSKLLDAYLVLIKKAGNTNLEYYRGIASVYRGLLVNDSQNSQYHASLAYVYKTLGEYDKAAEQAFWVFNFQPENKEMAENFIKALFPFATEYPAIHYFLASIYIQTGPPEKAKEELIKTKYLYLQLISKYPTNANYHLNLARTYKELGEYEKAKEEEQKAQELAP